MYYRISLNLLAQLGLMLHPGWFHQHHTTPSLFTERASETLDMYFFLYNLRNGLYLCKRRADAAGSVTDVMGKRSDKEKLHRLEDGHQKKIHFAEKIMIYVDNVIYL